MIAIHDNEVQSYTVDLKNHTIRLDTTWAHEDRREHSLIEFRGVMAHYLHGANNWQNVLNRIEEEPLETWFLEYEAVLEAAKGIGWPCLYEDRDDLLRQLREEKMECFQIYDVIGLYGWVLAQEMEFVAMDETPQASYNHFDLFR